MTRGTKDYNRIKQDLAAAGYNGEKIVVLAATTIPSIWAEASVATDVLKQIGMDIDLQALEWGAVVSRRAVKEPPDHGGWNIFYTYLGGFGNISPGPNIAIRGTGTKAWFGWPTDEVLVKMRAEFADEADATKRKAIAEAMQLRVSENPTHIFAGQWVVPAAMRKNVTGALESPVTIFWNMEKK